MDYLMYLYFTLCPCLVYCVGFLHQLHLGLVTIMQIQFLFPFILSAQLAKISGEMRVSSWELSVQSVWFTSDILVMQIDMGLASTTAWTATVCARVICIVAIYDYYYIPYFIGVYII